VRGKQPPRPSPGLPRKGRLAALRERGEGAAGATATVFKVKRFFMQCLPVDNVAPTQCSI